MPDIEQRELDAPLQLPLHPGMHFVVRH